MKSGYCYHSVASAVILATVAFAQDAPPRGRGGGASPARAAVAYTDASFPMPEQRIKSKDELKLRQDSFTFVRVQYDTTQRVGVARRGRGGRVSTVGGIWMVDYPEADQNFIRCFQEVTQIQTELEPKVMRLTDAELAKYPFLYVVEGAYLQFTAEEAQGLRKYLDGGGFLLVDDSWGEASWQNLVDHFKLVFPDQEPQDLDLSHPIFHNFYDFQALPQVLSFNDPSGGAEPVRYAGFTNGSGRLMVLICHNNDLGDGWEREQIDVTYAKEFSQKRAFPMGINIVVYALSRGQEN